MDSDDEPQWHSSASRVRRAWSLGALSALALTVAGLAYLHPGWPLGSAAAHTQPSGVRASSHLAAVDFVTASMGWVVVDHQSQDFALLHTFDAGQTWNLQLAGSAEVIGEYLRFFDASNGVLVVLGTQAALYRTADAGVTWRKEALSIGGGYVLSADFVDAKHGWLLAQASTEGEALMRTDDGGRTWVGLGNPVAYSDWAYRVVFSDLSSGWLYSESTRPYAYKSVDGGTSWHRLALPEPPGGWPSPGGESPAGGRVYVAAHPTNGAGVSVTVVIGTYAKDLTADDAAILQDSPVQRVQTFDGGGSMTSIYADVWTNGSFSSSSSSPRYDAQPANQFQLSSVDGGRSWKAFAMPARQGGIAYVDSLHWWWIGSGVQARSSDAGGSWSPIRTLLVPAPLPESLQIIDATHIWFGAMAGPRPLVVSTEDGGVVWTMSPLPTIAEG